MLARFAGSLVLIWTRLGVQHYLTGVHVALSPSNPVCFGSRSAVKQKHMVVAEEQFSLQPVSTYSSKL